MISGFVGDSVQNYLKYADEELKQIASAISFFTMKKIKMIFLLRLKKNMGNLVIFSFLMRKV